jgi:hypothetical protein
MLLSCASLFSSLSFLWRLLSARTLARRTNSSSTRPPRSAQARRNFANCFSAQPRRRFSFCSLCSSVGPAEVRVFILRSRPLCRYSAFLAAGRARQSRPTRTNLGFTFPQTGPHLLSHPRGASLTPGLGTSRCYLFKSRKCDAYVLPKDAGLVAGQSERCGTRMRQRAGQRTYLWHKTRLSTGY